jgi:hypothetical protein
MHRTNIYLDERQCEALDRLAAEEGTSRADLIRRVLDNWLSGGDRNVQRDLDAIEASFGALADSGIPERAPDERAAHLDRVWRLGA